MKKLITLLFFVVLTITGFSQSFFRPVNQEMFKKADGTKVLTVTQKWELRPAIAISAVQLNWNKLTKQFDASAFNSAGLGIGYQHFVELASGEPFNNFGFNGILLIGADNITYSATPTISFAVTGSFLQYVNLGALYNFTNKAFGILTGVNLKF